MFPVAALLCAAVPVTGQVRGVYPLGMSAVNAGSLFGPGATYVNAFLFYARDELRGAKGELVSTGQQTVLMDLNTIAWASRKPVLSVRASRRRPPCRLPTTPSPRMRSARRAVEAGSPIRTTSR
jgi:hypothetical protein